MKLNVLTSLLTILVFSAISCVNKSSDTAAHASDKPNPTYLDSINGDDYNPEVGDDDDGFNAISNKIRYPELPQDLSTNLFADSLLQVYNTVLAYNTMAYDVSTAERYMDAADLVSEEADALDSINLSGIRNELVKNKLANLGHESAKWLRKGKKPNEQDIKEVGEFYEIFNNVYDPFLSAHMQEVEYNPADILKDYQEVHAKAISDTTTFRGELLQRVLQEQDFEKKCILAREFAYANYKHPERDDRQLAAVLDRILSSGQYSPLLGELWLMWRTALQKDIISGPSNDSAMYNLFYNDMRNRVALSYISHLAENPNDSVAFLNFYILASEYNIVRNSGCLFGNNSLLDEMNLYYYVINEDM